MSHSQWVSGHGTYIHPLEEERSVSIQRHRWGLKRQVGVRTRSNRVFGSAFNSQQGAMVVYDLLINRGKRRDGSSLTKAEEVEDGIERQIAEAGRSRRKSRS